MGTALQDRRDQSSGLPAGLLRPAYQPFRGPLGVMAVAGRHVVDQGRKAALLAVSDVAGHPLALAEQLHRVGRQPGIQLLFDQLVRHRVVVFAYLDMVIDVDPHLLPVRVLVRHSRQGAQGRGVHRLEHAPATSFQLLERPVVQLIQKLPDGLVQLGQTEEGAVAQAGQDPPLGHLDPRLDLGFVLGTPDAGRHHGDAVMDGHVLIGWIQIGFIEVWAGHPGPQVVRHQDLTDAAEEREPPDVRSDPVEQPLAPGRLAEGVAAGPHHREEDLGEADLAGAGVGHRHRLPGVIDEQLLARLVDLPHHRVLAVAPLLIKLAEPAVLQPAGGLGPVLLP